MTAKTYCYIGDRSKIQNDLKSTSGTNIIKIRKINPQTNGTHDD